MIAWIAGRQHGIVTWAELLSAGISRAEIKHRLRIGLLIRVYPGVYRVGHSAASAEARYMAAVKACGKGAVLSHRAAGHLLGILRGKAPPPEVLTPTQRKIKGLRTRHSRRIHPEDSFTWRGIPVTSVPRTLVDLSSLLSAEDLARAAHEAGVRHRTTPRHVERALARRPNATGASIDERRVDCHWRTPPLIVELDSYRFHHSRHAWENDRKREREARAAGYEFRRYTYGDVTEDTDLMLSELRALLVAAR